MIKRYRSTVQGLVALTKISSIFFLMGVFTVHSLSYELMEPRRWQIRKLRATLVHKYAKIVLKILGISVTSESHGQHLADNSHLFVGNHLSYLDVLVLAAHRPACFVTSREVRDIPVLGLLTQLGGCLFVERRSRKDLSLEIQELSEALSRGIDVTVFPEATSTNGEAVLRFRRPLFRAAVDARRPVRPFCLNYRKLNDQNITLENRDTVCWYGSMAFVPHLWQVVKQKRIFVDLLWLSDLDVNLASDVTDLSVRAHTAVNSVFSPYAI